MVQIKRLNIVFLTLIWSLLVSCGIPSENENTTNIVEESFPNVEEIKTVEDNRVKVKIKTTLGDVSIVLFEETPKHKENFVKLVNENFYDSTLFHRVIKDFMIQGGDPQSKGAAAGIPLGQGGPGYTIEAEIQSGLYHKKGALCAARQGDQMNPEKRSSGSQFYLVTGKKFTEQELSQMEMQQSQQAENNLMQAFIQTPENSEYLKRLQDAQAIGKDPAKRAEAQEIINKLTEEIKPLALKDFKPFKFSDEQRKEYLTNGGTPFLDNNYTVFGEVVEGMDIIDKIGLVGTAPGDRPLEDVVILSMEIIK